MKVATIVGARPQFVKAAALSRAILKEASSLQEVLIHTGQHFDPNMSEVFFQEMEIPKPHHFLGISGLSQGAMTGRMMEALESVLIEEKPDWVLVFGDTNSTLAGALTAAKLHIPVAHVEAGLRSFNRKMPEEINRVLTDHCSTLLFTPTELATNQLKKEGIETSKIVQVGDVMVDAIAYYQEKAKAKSQIFEELGLKSKEYVLATIHRAENTDNPERLKEIFKGLQRVAKHCPVVIPLHPRTKKALQVNGLLNEVEKNLTVIDPVGYLEMIELERNAKVIMTDSGGIQKEAYVFQVPCLTLRTETEWVELVEMGVNKLVPLEEGAIEKAFLSCDLHALTWKEGVYGQGDACKRVIQELLKP